MSSFARSLAIVCVAGTVLALGMEQREQTARNHRQADFDLCVVGGIAVARAVGMSLKNGGVDVSACLEKIAPDLPDHIRVDISAPSVGS